MARLSGEVGGGRAAARARPSLVENGKTLNEWTIEQSVEIDGPGAGKHKKKLDWLLWLVSLLLFNLMAWAGLGWIVLRVVRSLL